MRCAAFSEVKPKELVKARAEMFEPDETNACHTPAANDLWTKWPRNQPFQHHGIAAKVYEHAAVDGPSHCRQIQSRSRDAKRTSSVGFKGRVHGISRKTRLVFRRLGQLGLEESVIAFRPDEVGLSIRRSEFQKQNSVRALMLINLLLSRR